MQCPMQLQRRLRLLKYFRRRLTLRRFAAHSLFAGLTALNFLILLNLFIQLPIMFFMSCKYNSIIKISFQIFFYKI